MKKNIILFIFLLLSYVGYTQEYIDDSNFDDKINEQSAFGDDETNIVVVEFCTIAIAVVVVLLGIDAPLI